MNLILLLTLSLVLSCIPGQKSNVTIQGQSSIVNQVVLASDIEKNIGEWSLESDPLDFTVTLTNNSSHAITNISATLNKKGEIDGLDYTTTTSLALYPGKGGTCQSRLESGETCDIKLSFEPTASGQMAYDVIFDYKTLIEAERQSLSFFALAGTPASLVFTNNISEYDLGIVEQVDDEPGEKRFPLVTPLEIQNRGELSARDVVVSLTETNDEPNAFEVLSNNCPKLLKRDEICEIEIAYTPFNQDINDPEKLINRLSLRYGKDQNNRPRTLTGLFKAFSTKIEGRFEKSGLQSFCFKLTSESSCAPVTVGNTATSSFKVVNQGYQDAILKKIIVLQNENLIFCEYDGEENLLCYLAGYYLQYNSSGVGIWYLNGGSIANEFDETGYDCITVEENRARYCFLPEPSKSQLSLYDFPFLLQDTDGCMANETRVSGKDIFNVGSERCEIGIKFHPPLNYNKVGQDPAGQEIDSLPEAGSPPLEIAVQYDSLWKDKVDTYITNSPPLFLSEPKSYSEARLRVTKFIFGDLEYAYKTPDQVIYSADKEVNYDETDYFHDLGRYAMVLDSTVQVDARIRIKNFGKTRANITQVFSPHGQEGSEVVIPSKDSLTSNNIDFSCSPSPEPFFRNVRHYCPHDPDTGETWLEPNESCVIRFIFTPVSETNKINQNYCMFGIPTTDSRYDAACQASPSSCNAIIESDKRHFRLEYTNGITKDDDLDNFTGGGFIDFHFDATLAASGKLEIAPLAQNNTYLNGVDELNIDGVPPGFYKYGFIELRNVGSNSVPYIYLAEDNNMGSGTVSNPLALGLSFVKAMSILS